MTFQFTHDEFTRLVNKIGFKVDCKGGLCRGSAITFLLAGAMNELEHWQARYDRVISYPVVNSLAAQINQVINQTLPKIMTSAIIKL